MANLLTESGMKDCIRESSGQTHRFHPVRYEAHTMGYRRNGIEANELFTKRNKKLPGSPIREAKSRTKRDFNPGSIQEQGE